MRGHHDGLEKISSSASSSGAKGSTLRLTFFAVFMPFFRGPLIASFNVEFSVFACLGCFFFVTLIDKINQS